MATAKIKTVLTAVDREALALMPDGWFVPTNLPYLVRSPDYRCDRLHQRGELEFRVTGTYPSLRSEYRKVVRTQGV